MTHHAHNKCRYPLRWTMLAALAVVLSACASMPATVPHDLQAKIKRVGVVSLVENEMHAYFKVGPVLRERVGATVRESYLGPAVLGRWLLNRRLAAATGKALGPRYVPLRYDLAKLTTKAFKSDPEHMNLDAIKQDLRRIANGRVDTIIIVTTTGSTTRVVGRRVWLRGYGFYRQSVQPGAPTVDYAAVRLTVVDAKTMEPLADRSAFASRRLPTSLWDINVTTITPKQSKALREHVGSLLEQTVGRLVQAMGLGSAKEAG